MAKYFVWLHTRLDELPPIFLQALLEIILDRVVEELCDQLVARAALRHTDERSGDKLVAGLRDYYFVQDDFQSSLEEDWRVFIQTAVEDQRQSTWARDNFVGPRLGTLGQAEHSLNKHCELMQGWGAK